MSDVAIRFVSYVEGKTKITSTFAFLLSVSYLKFIEVKINWYLTLIFFVAMLIFDLTTTAINNYIDTKTNKEKLQFNRKTALIIIYVMFIICAALGLYLAYLTDLVVLFAGGLCFLCGIFYTYGPIPISRQPLGEIMSGLFYGFFIPFLLFQINMPTGTFVAFNVSFENIDINLKVQPLVSLIILSIIPFCTTANIMLANNICDLDKDITVKRYTLPYYLGIKSSLKLFAGLYYLTYFAVILLVVLKFISPICLLFILTIMPVQKNISDFLKIQNKKTTFMVSIKNYLIIMNSITILVIISTLLQHF